MKEKMKKFYEFSNSWTGTIIIVLFVIFFIAQAFVIPSGSMKKTLLIGDHLFVKKFAYGIPTPHLPWLEWQVLPDFNGNGHLIEGDKPKRGDIVVFRYPNNEKIHYVKRCFAKGGDEIIMIEDKIFLRPSEGDDYIKKNYPKEKLIILQNKLWVENPISHKFPGIHYGGNNNSAFDILASRFINNAKNDIQPIMINKLPKYSSLPFNAFYKKVEPNKFYMIGDNRDNSNDSRFWGSVPYRLIVGKPWFIYFSWDKDKKLRWDRIGRIIDDLELNKKYIKEEN